MKQPVIAIGLDAADPVLLETWMAQGHLPTLNRLRQEGAYGRLHNTIPYGGVPTETSETERLWAMFSSACLPYKTGYWGPVLYDPATYGISHDTVNGAYDFQEYPLFYALGDRYRVAAFDVPVSALSDGINGVQILGWGGHAPHTPSHSEPPEVLPDLIRRYGKNPVLHQDYGYWWDQGYLTRIRQALQVSIGKRAEICRELLQQEPWDLFLTVFGETHSATHDFWHLSQADHPLHPHTREQWEGQDPMLETFQAVDRAIADILAIAPENAHVVIFAVHGMGNNVTDAFSMMFLPEFLYRFSFPGKYGLAKGTLGNTPPPTQAQPRRKSWAGEVWQLKYDANPVKRWLRRWLPSKFDPWLKSGQSPDLVSPHDLLREDKPLNWMPATWYQPLWSQMKAFALPAFASGHIRINLQGREPHGIVSPADYEATCDELTQLLHGLRDARTGVPLVKEVVRTRQSAQEDSPKHPDPDLVVVWNEQPTDVVDSPELGRIGPVTYYRPGGHRPRGFVLAQGPQIAAGSDLPVGQAIDVGPTILELMGAPIPAKCDGQPLVRLPVPQLAPSS